MHITISGQHFSIGDSLKEHVENNLNESTGKYCEQAISAEVHFSKERHNNLYDCNIIVKDGSVKHHVYKGEGNSDDIYTAFNQAMSKIDTQLSKQKSKSKDHHQKIHSVKADEFDKPE